MLDFLMANKDLWLVPINLLGIYFNIRKLRACFLIWVPSNFIFSFYSWHRDNYSMVALQSCYFLMNIWGLYAWRKQPWFLRREA